MYAPDQNYSLKPYLEDVFQKTGLPSNHVLRYAFRLFMEMEAMDEDVRTFDDAEIEMMAVRLDQTTEEIRFHLSLLDQTEDRTDGDVVAEYIREQYRELVDIFPLATIDMIALYTMDPTDYFEDKIDGDEANDILEMFLTASPTMRKLYNDYNNEHIPFHEKEIEAVMLNIVKHIVRTEDSLDRFNRSYYGTNEGADMDDIKEAEACLRALTPLKNMNECLEQRVDACSERLKEINNFLETQPVSRMTVDGKTFIQPPNAQALQRLDLFERQDIARQNPMWKPRL